MARNLEAVDSRQILRYDLADIKAQPQSIVHRFFKTVGHKLNAIQAQRKVASQYRMDIDSYQAKLKQALNSLFHAMKAEIDLERDPREKEALRLGEREPSRYLIGHRFNDTTAQLVKEVSQAYELDHPNFAFHPRFHEGLQVAWVRSQTMEKTLSNGRFK
jgi:hypothetical protein